MLFRFRKMRAMDPLQSLGRARRGMLGRLLEFEEHLAKQLASGG